MNVFAGFVQGRLSCSGVGYLSVINYRYQPKLFRFRLGLTMFKKLNPKTGTPLVLNLDSDSDVEIIRVHAQEKSGETIGGDTDDAAKSPVKTPDRRKSSSSSPASPLTPNWIHETHSQKHYDRWSLMSRSEKLAVIHSRDASG